MLEWKWRGKVREEGRDYQEKQQGGEREWVVAEEVGLREGEGNSVQLNQGRGLPLLWGPFGAPAFGWS